MTPELKQTIEMAIGVLFTNYRTLNHSELYKHIALEKIAKVYSGLSDCPIELKAIIDGYFEAMELDKGKENDNTTSD